MQKLKLITFSVPETFVEKLVLFERLIERDKEFIAACKKMQARYQKKTINNKLRSAKFRFIIAKYLRDVQENA